MGNVRMEEVVLGISDFHFARVESAKNSDVFLGAKSISASNLTTFVGTASYDQYSIQLAAKQIDFVSNEHCTPAPVNSPPTCRDSFR